MMRLLANENIPYASIRLLRQAGHDVASIQEDQPGSTDEEVLASGKQEDRIILTFDRDYGAMIFQQKLSSPGGIVYFHYQAPKPEEPAEQLLQVLKTYALEHMFTPVDRQHIRQRPLS